MDLYKEPDQVIARADEAGVYVLSVTTTPKAWPGTKRLTAGRPRIRTALGLHPQLAHERYSELSLFEMMLPEAEYLGEIGLDGSKGYKSHSSIQKKVFETILMLSQRVGGRIMTIHSRGSAEAVLDCLHVHSDAGLAVMHWFTGTQDELMRAVSMGCWFSVGPAMLKSRGGVMRAALMPRDRILPETDGPFGRGAHGPLEPIDSRLAVAQLAEIWGVTVEEASNHVRENLKRIRAEFTRSD